MLLGLLTFVEMQWSHPEKPHDHQDSDGGKMTVAGAGTVFPPFKVPSLPLLALMAELPSFNPQGRHSDHHGGVPRGATRSLGQLPSGVPHGPAPGDALPHPVARI